MNDSQTKICLFGGTFDPIHLGHTFIASKAVEQLGLDKVVFLPCRQSPHKLNKQSAANHHRLAMCELATVGLPWAEVSDFDLVAQGPSYSWRTAEHFAQRHPEAQLFWLMGTDQWESLERWSRASYFAQLVTIVVYSRDVAPQQKEGFDCIPLTSLQHPASATSVREAQLGAHASAWLHPKVAHYLQENALYRKSHLD